MLVTLTIVRYPKKYIPFAIMAMAMHHIPLWLNKKISFYKLLGCGKNGTFDKNPDWQQWGILTVRNKIEIMHEKELSHNLFGSFIQHWLRFFNTETWTIFLEPIEGHGKWDGKEPFGQHTKSNTYDGPVAVLTRASIRLSKLKAFWSNVGKVAVQMDGAKGFITSVGIGEMPYIKQATFSIWQSKEDMKAFAYQMREHQEVIKKTRKENWYSEDMFTRFKPLQSFGTIKGCNPLEGIL
jgi:heme-degrading monooxygenase HmoA